MRLTIVRHADPDYPNNTITPRGHDEAAALADRFAGERVDRLYTSPMGRARDTAGYTAKRLGMEPEVLPWAAELASARVDDGAGHPMVFWNVAGQYVRSGEVEIDDWAHFPTFAPLPPPDSADDDEPPALDVEEVVRAVRTGSDEFLAALGLVRDGGVYRVVSPDAGEVVVFCHAGLAATWVAHLLDLPMPLAWCGLFFATSSVTTVLFETRTEHVAVPRLVCLSDTSHLYASGLGENPRGLPANVR